MSKRTHAPRVITSLSSDDERRFTANAAGPAALLVAKLHKVGDRLNTPDRLNDKDAHQLYRPLIAIDTVRLQDETEAFSGSAGIQEKPRSSFSAERVPRIGIPLSASR